MRSISRITGVSINPVSKLLEDVGRFTVPSMTIKCTA
jgi:hypothetical protein